MDALGHVINVTSIQSTHSDSTTLEQVNVSASGGKIKFNSKRVLLKSLE
jgi:hypothetical protein